MLDIGYSGFRCQGSGVRGQVLEWWSGGVVDLWSDGLFTSCRDVMTLGRHSVVVFMMMKHLFAVGKLQYDDLRN